MTKMIVESLVRLLQTRLSTIILVILLLVSLPLFFLCNYGNQAFDHLAPSDRAYGNFIIEKAVASDMTGGFQPGTLKSEERTRDVAFPDLVWEGDILVNRSTDRPIANFLREGMPHYIHTGRYDETLFEFWYGQPQFIPDMRTRLNQSVNYNLIYVNPETNLYLRNTE